MSQHVYQTLFLSLITRKQRKDRGKRERERKEKSGGEVVKELEEKHVLPFAFNLLSRLQCRLFRGSVQRDG